jgi:exopolyphosphatase/guanosine-5'-triphosphate,3'-diphosphate pyrophosphatase
MLGWAARLHELGLDIAHNQYHKHGAYVLEHADLPGFSREEQTVLGHLVRAHRRKFPVRLFSVLRGSLAERTKRLAIILRLAVVLHRSRLTAPLPTFTCEASGDRILVSFPPGWLEEHPLTAADLAEEAGFLAPAGITLVVT